MISGLADAFLWTWLAAAQTAAAANAGAPADLDSLLASLAREPPQSIAFVEAHSSKLLEHDLVVAGRLEYLGKGKLSRIVTDPYEERTDIDGDDIRIQREGRPARQFSLRHSPELGGLLSAFSALLEGDRAALERGFELSSVIAAEGWQLMLRPRGARTRDRIGEMRVRGVGSAPECLVVLTKEGGTTSEILLGSAAGGADLALQRVQRCGALP